MQYPGQQNLLYGCYNGSSTFIGIAKCDGQDSRTCLSNTVSSVTLTHPTTQKELLCEFQTQGSSMQSHEL